MDKHAETLRRQSSHCSSQQCHILKNASAQSYLCDASLSTQRPAHLHDQLHKCCVERDR